MAWLHVRSVTNDIWLLKFLTNVFLAKLENTHTLSKVVLAVASGSRRQCDTLWNHV